MRYMRGDSTTGFITFNTPCIKIHEMDRSITLIGKSLPARGMWIEIEL
jgi:hypothetical protein